MKNFFKDLIDTQKACNKITLEFVKKHPVGYGCFIIGSFAVGCAIPMAILKIEEKKEEKSITREWNN